MAGNQLHRPRQALRFLVEFSQADVESARHVTILSRRLAGFLQSAAPGSAFGTLDRAAIRHLQQRTFEILNDAAQRRSFTVAGDLVLTFWAFSDGAAFRVDVGGSPLDRLLYQTIRVLEAVGPGKLLACPAPGCGKIFVKITKKRFCSQRCQSRIYMRAKRARSAPPSKR